MRSISLAALMLILACAAPANAAEPITKRQARVGKAAVVHRQILGQVGDLLDPRKDDPGKPLRTPLDFAALQTVARTTPVAGLCRVDILWVEFAKAGSTGTGPDEPRRASGFTATSHFLFKTPPPAGANFAIDLRLPAEARPEAAPCKDALDDDSFRAEDPEEAANGYLMFRRVIAEAAAGPSWSVECLRQGPEKRDCLPDLVRLQPPDLASVSDCGPLRDAAAYTGDGCVDLTTHGDMIIRVHGGDGTKGGRPLPITRVEVLQQLILSHEPRYD